MPQREVREGTQRGKKMEQCLCWELVMYLSLLPGVKEMVDSVVHELLHTSFKADCCFPVF